MDAFEEKAKSILFEASELPESEREDFLREVCQGDETLLARVKTLLRHADPTSADAAETFKTPGFANNTAKQYTEPTHVGPYTIVRKIGEGGMGVVYKALQEMPKRTVALKLIKPHAISDHALERFRHEVEVLAKLQHPGIAQIFSAGTLTTELGEQPYFAMEFIRGRSLDDYTRATEPNLKERLRLFAKVADAVHHAHMRGVVHRDLKPGNILVTDEGEPKILDFGVARSTDAAGKSSAPLTQVGQFIGTLAYMSPEQVGGRPDDVDARSDVYSLGVVLYQLLTGSMPYKIDQRAIVEAVRVIRDEEPSSISTINRTLRGDVEIIVNKAMEKERTRRYQSASELAGDIARFLNDEGITARRPSAAYQLSKFAKRHRVLAGGAALAAAGICFGFALTAWQWSRAEAANVQLTDEQARTQAALEEVTVERDRATFAAQELGKLLGAIDDFENSVLRLEGSTPARRAFATASLDMLDRASEKLADAPWLQDELARGYLRVARISNVDSTDDVSEVLSAAEKANEIYKTLTKSPDATEQQWAGLIQSASLMGYANVLSGNISLGRHFIQGALEDAKTAAEATSDSGPIGLAAASAAITNAEIHRYTGRHELALQACDEATTFLLNVAKDRASEAEFGELLSRIATSRAKTYDALDRPNEATLAYKQASDTLRRLADANPRDAIIRHRLATALRQLGRRARLKELDNEQALEYTQEALFTLRRLTEADPDYLPAQKTLIDAYNDLAQLYETLGDSDVSRRASIDAYNAAKIASERAPLNVFLRRRLAITANTVGESFASSLASASPDPTEALRWFETAADLMRPVHAAEPNEDSRKVLRDILRNVILTRKQIATDLPARELIPTYDEAIEIAGGFETPSAYDRNVHAALWRDRADCHAAIGQHDRAVLGYEKANTIYPVSPADQPVRFAAIAERMARAYAAISRAGDAVQIASEGLDALRDATGERAEDIRTALRKIISAPNASTASSTSP